MKKQAVCIQILSLMTANVDIAMEAAEVFQALSMGETVESCGYTCL